MSTDLLLGSRPLETLRRALRQAGVQHNAYGNWLLPRIPIAAEPTAVTVVVRSVAELGFTEGSELDPLLDAVASAGLAPCPLEAAVLLRLAWPGRVLSTRITVASRRLVPVETEPRGLYLSQDASGDWLRGFVASDDWHMEPTEQLALWASGVSRPAPDGRAAASYR